MQSLYNILIFFFSISCFFSTYLKAQNIDLKRQLLRSPNLSVQYTNYDNGLLNYQINAGSPPKFWGLNKKYFLVLNTSLNHTELTPTHINERVDFNKVSLVPIFRMTLNSKWSFSTVLPFSFAQEEGSSFFNSRGLALVGVGSFTKTISSSGTNFGLGIVMIKLAQSFLIVPNFSYSYVSPDYHWAFRFGFPRISLEKIFERFIIGSFASINFDTFLLSPNTPLTTNLEATYLNSEKTLIGLRLHFKGFENIFLDFETGLIINEKLFLSNDQRDPVVGTDFSRKGFETLFTNFVIGYKF